MLSAAVRNGWEERSEEEMGVGDILSSRRAEVSAAMGYIPICCTLECASKEAFLLKCQVL